MSKSSAERMTFKKGFLAKCINYGKSTRFVCKKSLFETKHFQMLNYKYLNSVSFKY